MMKGLVSLNSITHTLILRKIQLTCLIPLVCKFDSARIYKTQFEFQFQNFILETKPHTTQSLVTRFYTVTKQEFLWESDNERGQWILKSYFIMLHCTKILIV